MSTTAAPESNLPVPIFASKVFREMVSPKMWSSGSQRDPLKFLFSVTDGATQFCGHFGPIPPSEASVPITKTTLNDESVVRNRLPTSIKRPFLVQRERCHWLLGRARNTARCDERLTMFCDMRVNNCPLIIYSGIHCEWFSILTSEGDGARLLPDARWCLGRVEPSPCSLLPHGPGVQTGAFGFNPVCGRPNWPRRKIHQSHDKDNSRPPNPGSTPDGC